MNMERKLNIGQQTTWPTHFFGWKPCLDALQLLHNDQGIKFIGYLDEVAGFQTIQEPFVGFFHHVPINPDNIKNSSWSQDLKGLEFYLQTPVWKRNEKRCLGLFTLCKYLATYLQSKTDTPVCSLIHAYMPPRTFFSFEAYLANKNKLLLNPGNWCRNFEAFNQLKSPYQKAITGKWLFLNPNPTIIVLGHLHPAVYDTLITQNIIFQNYFDVAASNTIIECIAKNIPLILNRLPASEEYLGADYPLFYNDLGHAESLINNDDDIYKGYQYLLHMDKTRFAVDYFFRAFYESDIYTRLRKPLMR